MFASTEKEFRMLYSNLPPGKRSLIQLESKWEWDLYTPTKGNGVMNTFRLIFYKFKKGIYVKISGRKVFVIAFDNKNYTNEWSHLIENSPDGSQWWWANNYLFRKLENNVGSTTDLDVVTDMFTELVKYHDIPDCEFFVNRRDFPLLRMDLHETYQAIWGHTPMVSEVYDEYCPILSCVTSRDHVDVPIPTPEEWTYLRYHEGKKFNVSKKVSKSLRESTPNKIPWTNKINKFVFRGSLTGEFFDDRNDRIRYCSQALTSKYKEYLDVGITNVGERPHIEDGKIVYPPNIREFMKPFMSTYDQSSYRYIIHLPGHVESYRLTRELSYGSVILMPQCPWKMWYDLTPWVHYVPIESSLDDAIEWCLNHPTECEEMSKVTIGKSQMLTHLKDVTSWISSLGIPHRKLTLREGVPDCINIVDQWLFEVSTRELWDFYCQVVLTMAEFHARCLWIHGDLRMTSVSAKRITPFDYEFLIAPSVVIRFQCKWKIGFIRRFGGNSFISVSDGLIGCNSPDFLQDVMLLMISMYRRFYTDKDFSNHCHRLWEFVTGRYPIDLCGNQSHTGSSKSFKDIVDFLQIGSVGTVFTIPKYLGPVGNTKCEVMRIFKMWGLTKDDKYKSELLNRQQLFYYPVPIGDELPVGMWNYLWNLFVLVSIEGMESKIIDIKSIYSAYDRRHKLWKWYRDLTI